MSLDAIYNLREPTLVIAPLEIMYTTWMNEPEKWDFSQSLKYTILHGKDKDLNFNKRCGIMFINPEGIPWLLKKIKSARRFPWKVLVVDESIKFKNHKSVRFKALRQMLKTFKYRYILSGNPIPNTYLDIWAQIFILDLGERLGTSWYRFRDKYFYPIDYNRFKWELKPGAKEEIIRKISDITFFLDTDDEIDLPEIVEIDVPITLPATCASKYKKMEEELFAQLDTGDNVTAPNKASGLMKCWQIANGFLYEQLEDGTRKTHFMHNELAKQAEAFVESMNGRPCVITYHFEEDLNRLKKSFPDARVVGAGMTGEDIRSIEQDWNDDKIPILLAYISKLSHGLNLQHGSGHHIFTYCLTYNFDTYDQLIFRFKRQGAQYGRVVVHRPICQNTVHEAIIRSLNTKGRNAKDFLRALQSYRLNNLDS